MRLCYSTLKPPTHAWLKSPLGRSHVTAPAAWAAELLFCRRFEGSALHSIVIAPVLQYVDFLWHSWVPMFTLLLDRGVLLRLLA